MIRSTLRQTMPLRAFRMMRIQKAIEQDHTPTISSLLGEETILDSWQSLLVENVYQGRENVVSWALLQRKTSHTPRLAEAVFLHGSRDLIHTFSQTAPDRDMFLLMAVDYAPPSAIPSILETWRPTVEELTILRSRAIRMGTRTASSWKVEVERTDERDYRLPLNKE